MSGRSYHQFLEDRFDQTVGTDTDPKKLVPFMTVAQKDDDEVLKWLESTQEILEKEQEQRAQLQLKYMRFYNAVEVLGQSDAIRAVDSDDRPVTKAQRFLMNHARDLVNQPVSRLMRYSSNLNVLPQNNEYSDRIGARYGKRVVNHLFYINDMREIFETMLREGKICGESFLFVEWDPSKGDKDATQARAKDLVERGAWDKFTDSDGNVIPLDVVARVGDVSFEQPLPWFVLQEPAFRWRDVSYIFKLKIKHIEEIRAENRGINLEGVKTLDLHRGKDGSFGPGFKYGEWVIQSEFYHKGTPFVDQGAYIRFIPGIILKRDKLPYSHRELPLVRFTDYDDPMNAHGRSFFDDIRPPLILFNKLMNLQYRNIAIGAHPKLMVPAGSCNIHSMANGPLVVEYEGQIKPEIMTFQSLTPEVFTFSENLINQVQQIAGTFGVSRGEVPPNARAGSILNFYEEQEEQRDSFQIKKFTSAIEKTGRLSLATAGDFYKPEDGRTARIVGKNNQYKLRKITDTTKLSGPYDVKVERTTALAESKQGRIDQIQTLSTIPLASQADAGKPGLFTREQILRMIEVADLPTFFEMATAAVEKAESENEDLFEGISVTEPQKWEAHLVHWNAHFQFMQSREFTDTNGLPEQVRQAFLDHFMVHEMFMYELAQKSLSFCQGLMENAYFPAVFDITGQPTIAQLIMIHQAPPPPPMPPAEEAPPEGELPPEEDPLPPAPTDDVPDETPVDDGLGDLGNAEEIAPEDIADAPLGKEKLVDIVRDDKGQMMGMRIKEVPLRG